jgi:uncharacterized protein (TIGR03118 family)
MIRAKRHRPTVRSTARLSVEALEARWLLDAGFLQTNLVSDVPGLATSTDPNLKNPWGLVAGPAGPFWVSDNNAGVSTLYNGAGQPFPIASPLVVNIPTAAGDPTGGTPSGIVFNGSKTDFVVSQGGKSGAAVFLFATEDGLIVGWSPGVDFTHAIVGGQHAGAVYEGLASVTTGLGTFLLATNANGGIDVYDSKFDLINTVDDTSVPAGYTPYGIQNIGGKIYVTYANQSVFPSSPGNGLVDTFDPATGTFHRLITGGNLNLPWGMAIAPSDFGPFGGDLLVGNVADGHINAYNPKNGHFRGELMGTDGQPFTEPGLWSLKFGNDGLAGSSDNLFFTAGINGYSDGLLGSLTVPEHAVASHHISAPIIPNLPPSPTLFVNTNAPNGPTMGDQNPYGIAFVPPGFPSGGPLNPGDILVANFNDKTNPDGSGNLQGTGRTIVRVTPNGQTSVFFQAPSSIANVGLTTALGVLKSGFVLVGNVPTTDGTSGTIMAGSLMIIDKNGNLVQNLTDSALLDGPWDLTVNDQGDEAQVFVSNVLSGTVTRIDLSIPHGGNPIVVSKTQIASGYAHRTDPMALVVGPTGLAYDRERDILYVASTADNEIFAIRNAKDRASDGGTGKVVVKDDTHLHGPLGLLLAPNGDLITANGDAVNTDLKHTSEIVEFTPSGTFVGQISLNPLVDAPFGIALQFAAPDHEVRFAAVDDNTNTVHVWNIDLDGDSPDEHADSAAAVHAASATRPQGDDMAAASSAFFASLNSHQAESSSQPIDQLMAALLEPATPAPSSQPSGGAGGNHGPIFAASHALSGKALGSELEDTDPGLS